jgi:hypothetical protein
MIRMPLSPARYSAATGEVISVMPPKKSQK